METGNLVIEPVKEKNNSLANHLFVGCLRHGEDHSRSIGWKGGDCKTCLPDYLALGLSNFIPNKNCNGYIPCRYFWVVAS